ncbi:L,D-transpeptidase family protein [Roseovarius salinarum]|uniref:L,D-transpeptidase family protein n=1 Tax=Roseovarius salinarum TaxID=1981892 RepID=UPI000C3365B7|nr:L,D-transpeptidase family protein [Roseovarius salinarum]
MFAVFRTYLTRLTALTALYVIALPAEAQVTAFKQAVAEGAAQNPSVASFYQARDYEGIWTDESEVHRARRAALLEAIGMTAAHGLPARRYDADGLLAAMRSADTPRELGFLEARLSLTFARLAQNMRTGALKPKQVVNGIKREIPYRSAKLNLEVFTRASPRAFFRALPPQTNEYARLMKAKMRLEQALAEGGWGPTVPARAMKPGQQGRAVVALRDRLIAMGYLDRGVSRRYDSRLEGAVLRFQQDHGLKADGVAGGDTIREINTPLRERLQSVMVAMERERWLNRDRGKRHVLVNLTDFSARIVDDDRVTFRTKAVVGMDVPDRESPEFSDVMEHMVINPTWNVPRSIAVNEYLPQMQANPGAASHLRLYTASGRQVSRASVNFNAYTRNTFPFNLKQPPSPRNALGLVKFMFPNRHNIYLHDTPAKHLFQRDRRAYSHGCIRLEQPFEFAYTLLARQMENPKPFFHRILDTGRETQVDLEKQVPVHIIYRTAFTTPRGQLQYRDDIYGRDGRIWQALSRAGVSLRGVQG